MANAYQVLPEVVKYHCRLDWPWWIICLLHSHYTRSGIILCMHPTNESQSYIVMSSLIGWAHAQNYPCTFWTQSLCNQGAIKMWYFQFMQQWSHTQIRFSCYLMQHQTQTCGVWLDVLNTAELEIQHLECTLIMSTMCGVNTLLMRSLMKCPDLDRAYKLCSVNISPNIAVTKI